MPTDPPGVRELIRRRLAGETDRYRLGLAVEGGGMRGVVSGGMLLALRDLGAVDVFDRLYGTSSGALNLAYLAAGASWDALTIYYDHLVHGFVRSRRPLVDMGRVEHVIRTVLPLDVARLAASPLDVRLTVTDVAGCRPVVVPVRAVLDRVHEHLLAGAWLPILAGRPYVLDGRPYLDGGLLWPDPVYAALAEGCTHVLMLSTTTAARARRYSPTATRGLRVVLNRWSPGLGDEFLRGRQRWAADRLRLVPGRDATLDGGAVLRLIADAGAHRVERLTTDPGALLVGARAGYSTVLRVLDGGPRTSYFTLSATASPGG